MFDVLSEYFLLNRVFLRKNLKISVSEVQILAFEFRCILDKPISEEFQIKVKTWVRTMKGFNQNLMKRTAKS